MSQASQGETGDERADHRDEITWVGSQHLMHGFCGRAGEASGVEPADAPVLEVRPIAVVRTRPRQARVVRIGPPRSMPPTATSPVDAA
jgi:hypothetical protein